MSSHSARTQGKIRVLLVDDSPLALEIIGRMLAVATDIEVVGTAANGVEALDRIERLKPDVVCTDFHMPKMDGLELTREIMARSPLPILVVSVSVQAEQSANIIEMLGAGALDVVAKPRGGLDSASVATAGELIRKIRIVSGVVVIRRSARSGMPPPTAVAPSPAAPNFVTGDAEGRIRIVGIGASTGGPQAFESILGRLPADFPLPVVCAQHIAQGFMQGLVSWLATRCRIKVCTAVDGAAPQPGVAYFAPDGHHIELDAAGRFRCDQETPVHSHRPSIDLMLASLARVRGRAAAGVLLTGMGRDGVDGMAAIARHGGVTIAQDEATSIIFGMPRQAIAAGVAQHVLALDAIAPALVALTASTDLKRIAEQ